MSFFRVVSPRLAPSTTGLSKFIQSGSLHRSFTASAISKVDTQPEADGSWNGIDSVTRDLSQKLGRISNSLTKSPAEIWAEESQNTRRILADVGLVNNNPYIGRSVKIVDGDLADAFRKLDMILARNKVRKQLKLAERHEKKGPKRRRLESERWRRLFAHEVTV
ncbi:hypothetical protein J3R30DRAFT_874905 [Lentinula aciculospora]|uniref:Uncharacterized protein n=1 Tax=Lentinula aciculospora TaxID=153920 RepID=A0A9W9AQP4_9AGAR|nr:hypothetical protein J3R30DRAFT_874905 [Lentinula aciculospora]